MRIYVPFSSSLKTTCGSSFHVAVRSSLGYLLLLTIGIDYIISTITSAYIHLCISQVGSPDRHIHYYDLKNISQPLHIFNGHRKLVSYVKCISNSELSSASTDSTLHLWDVKENTPVRLPLIIHLWVFALLQSLFFSTMPSLQTGGLHRKKTLYPLGWRLGPLTSW